VKTLPPVSRGMGLPKREWDLPGSPGGVLPNLANVASKLLFQLLGNFNDIVVAR